MGCSIVWRRVRRTSAGVIRYYVIKTGRPPVYGLGIWCGQAAARCERVTARRGEAVALARRLVAGGVRPCHLQDILQDVLQDVPDVQGAAALR